MPKDNREDIHEVEFMFLSLIPKKIKVGIIGGGRAAAIKATSFLEQGCSVEVLSRDFIASFENLNRVELIVGEYQSDFIKDKHIIVIAIDDEKVVKEIISQCEEQAKIFINAGNYRHGNAAMSIQDSLGNINFALNTKGGNPKASLMIKEEIKNNLKEYDEFIGFINKLRSKAKEFNEYKQEIISFIATEDYKFMWEKRKEKECLLLFFKEELVHKLFN